MEMFVEWLRKTEATLVGVGRLHYRMACQERLEPSILNNCEKTGVCVINDEP